MLPWELHPPSLELLELLELLEELLELEQLLELLELLQLLLELLQLLELLLELLKWKFRSQEQVARTCGSICEAPGRCKNTGLP